MSKSKPTAWGLGLAALIIFPIIETNPAWTSIGVLTLMFMACTTSWNMFSGYSGYVSLGSAIFFGSGAYTMALVSTHAHMAGGAGLFWLIPLAGLVAMVMAVPVGAIALRVRRHTFVVITIALFFVFQLLAINASFTGGAAGIYIPLIPWGASYYNVPFYYVALGMVIFATLLSAAVRRSRFGLQLLAIRDDEDRALGLGVRVTAVKLTGFVMSAFTFGMAGALYCMLQGQIYPQFVFDPTFDITVALMAFLGGFGTLLGPLLGGLILEASQQYLTQSFSNGSLYLILFGVLFLLVILFMPQGIVVAVSQWWNGRAQRRELKATRDPAAVGAHT